MEEVEFYRIPRKPMELDLVEHWYKLLLKWAQDWNHFKYNIYHNVKKLLVELKYKTKDNLMPKAAFPYARKRKRYLQTQTQWPSNTIRCHVF